MDKVHAKGINEAKGNKKIMTFKNVLYKIKSRFYKKIYMCELSLDDLKEFEPSSFILLAMTPKLLTEMMLTAPEEISQRKKDIIQSRMDELSKEKSFIVKNKQNQIMGFCHMAVGDSWNQSIRDSVRVPKGHVYLLDDYTFQGSRRQGVQKFSVGKRLELAKDKGFIKALVQINANNYPSQKAYEAFGFNKKQVIHHLRLGSYQRNIQVTLEGNLEKNT